MPRGKPSPVGSERTSQNGYTYVKVAQRGWVLKHWLVAEEVLGRPIDNDTEMVSFVDGDRSNFSPDNITVNPRGQQTLRARIAALEAKINDLQARKLELEAQLRTEKD